MTSKLLVLCLGAVVASYIVEGSLLKLDVKYQYNEAVEPDSFLLSCAPNLGGDCDKSLLYLKVSRNNQLIASIQGDTTTDGNLNKDSLENSVYGTYLDSGVNECSLLGIIWRWHPATSRPRVCKTNCTFGVQGITDQDDPSKSFLDVRFKDVVKEDSGVYTCTAAYLGVTGDFSQDVASANVSITNIETKDLARQLMARVSFLDTIIKHNDNTTKTKVSEVEMNIFKHAAELNLLLNKVTVLEQSLKRHGGTIERKIKEMEAKLGV